VGGIALTAAVGVISAYLAPADWRRTLYALCFGIAVLTGAQTVRAVRAAVHHERDLSELREGQAYLSQPEAYRQMDLIWQQYAGVTAAEDLFQENFEIDDREATATHVRCKVCDWHEVKALVYARQDAVQHYRAFHVPPGRTGSRWRRLLSGTGLD
jgi:hypothetical protein